MESFTHESDESSSCTQSDGDSTNSSNGTNPFLLCPRGNSLQVGGHGRPHNSTEDTRPFKVARLEPSGHHQFHASPIANPQGVTSVPFAHNVIGAIHGSESLHGSTLLSQGRSYPPPAFEDFRGLPPQVASAARPTHGGLPYLGATQNFFTHDQWTGLRQQTYVLKHVAAGNTPSSALLLPMNCNVEKMPINFGNNPGSFFLGLADPQPGRCRRTDGKKWRCGRAVVPEQKYCERHMHRGRGRSKTAKLSAKIPTPVDANQSHNSGRPLNQPLIQLLNQLTVPGQPLGQLPDTVQQPPVPAQPLKWLQQPAQSFQQPHTHLPHLAQPLLTEPLKPLPIQSKPLDWPINQSPMQAEPLNLVQSNGRPPILAQAIPMNAVTEVKVRHDPANGLAVSEVRRMHTDDPNDVFNLDVQGIKRLLENAPCSVRSRSSVNRQKQLPNVADLLNVAHIRNLNSQPKNPPSLMDILKMVDPGTNNSTNTSTTRIMHRQLPTAKDGGGVPLNRVKSRGDSPGTGHTGTLLSLALSEQAAEEQNMQYRSDASLLMAMPNKGTMSVKLFKVKSEQEEGVLDEIKPKVAKLHRFTEGECLLSGARDESKGPPSSISTEDCASDPASVPCHTSEATDGNQSELPLSVKESQNCSGSPANLEESGLNLREERYPSSCDLKKDVTNLAEKHFSVEGSNCQIPSSTLDINSSTPPDGCPGHPRSLIGQERSSPSSRKEAMSHRENSLKSDSGSLILLEGSLDSCDSSGKSEGFLPGLVEKSADLHGGSDSPDMSSPTSKRKKGNLHDSCANIDMNSPVLDMEEDGCQLGKPVLGKSSSSLLPIDLLQSSTSSMLPIEILQAKVAFDRSSSDSSCNASSFSKSALSLDPAALSKPEPSSQVSLAN